MRDNAATVLKVIYAETEGGLLKECEHVIYVPRIICMTIVQS